MGKIISILAILILLIALPAALYLVFQKTQFFSKAGSDDVPRDIKITNISDNSFTVTWWTLKPVGGFVSWGNTSALGKTTTDDRDEGSPKQYQTHHITLKGLTPKTTYYFKIGSGSKLYGDNGKNYTQVTAMTTAKPPAAPDPIFGKVTKSDGAIPPEVIVYARVGQGSLLSGYIRKDGNFLITLNNARTANLNDYINISESDLINLSVTTGDGQETKKSIKAGQRSSQIKLELEGGIVNTSSKQQDMNGDGVVNALDFVFSAKERQGR